MSSHHLAKAGGRKAALILLVLSVFLVQAIDSAAMASTTTTHTRTKITTTLTETTTATSNALGSRAFFVLVILLAGAASIAVVGGYVWGKRRTRKNLLGA